MKTRIMYIVGMSLFYWIWCILAIILTSCRTNEQKIAMRALVTSLQAVYGISKVTGHNAYANKACPCFQVPEEL